MVERTKAALSDGLDAVFSSLSDPTRRDILRRVARRSMSVGDVASHYTLTFAAIAKHLSVLERAGLVSKTRQGKEQVVTIAPRALGVADDYLENFRELWEARLDALGSYLKSINKKEK